MTINLIFGKTVDGQRHAGIGDPSIGGWLTVAAYFVTAVLCVRAGRNVDVVRLRWFWLVAAWMLFLFGINKQLDLQTWFAEVGRRSVPPRQPDRGLACSRGRLLPGRVRHHPVDVISSNRRRERQPNSGSHLLPQRYYAEIKATLRCSQRKQTREVKPRVPLASACVFPAEVPSTVTYFATLSSARDWSTAA